MCRNIRPLFNFDPPATDDDVRAAALQFVRKISGYNAPSAANTEAFNRAVEEVSTAAHSLLLSLQTPSPPKDRAVADAKARERVRARYVRIV